MYMIYMDEAGTSKNEPVSVVVGVVIHADTQWKPAEKLLMQAIDELVPADLRNGFTFHAKDIWNGYRSRTDWPAEQRQELVARVAAIPFKVNAAISVAKVRRDAPDLPIIEKFFRPHEFHHIVAFWHCLVRANRHIRRVGFPGEFGTAVAEDEPKLRSRLRKTLKAPQPALPPEHQRKTKLQEMRGEEPVATEEEKIDRIIDTVHFVEKDGAPLLQIADACAFSVSVIPPPSRHR